MCKDCDDEAKQDAEEKALGRLFGLEAKTLERTEKASTSADIVADVTLRGTPMCRDLLKDYTVLVNNVAEDVGESGLGIAVLVAVNPRFVELAGSTGIDANVAMMMTALVLKDLMTPLAMAIRRASSTAAQIPTPEMPSGDAGSKEN